MYTNEDFNSYFEIYPLIKEHLAIFLSDYVFLPAKSSDISADIFGYELSSPIIAKYNFNANQVNSLLQNALETQPPQLFGAKLIENATIQNGHILFSLTNDVYCAICKHIILNTPNPKLMDCTTHYGYALARMMMLAKKEGNGCPESAPVKEALWITFSLSSYINSPKRLKARLNSVSDALLKMEQAKPPKERKDFLNSLGDVGKCTSRFLYYAITHLGGSNNGT